MKQDLASLGEFGLIRQLTSRLRLSKKMIAVGPGDDCAVIRESGSRRLLLLTTDLLVEGIHFRRDWMTPREIGFKAMRVNLSDIAAMGGKPLYALVSVGLPKNFSVDEAENLFQGLVKAGEESGVSIVGGDTNRSRELILNIALVGESPDGKFLTRSGAKIGDAIYVTGTLGEAALGLHHLQKEKSRKDRKVLSRQIVPPDRLSIGYRLAHIPGIHSMIDLSDGLVGDLKHVLESSHVGAEIWVEQIPVSMLLRKNAKKLSQDPCRLALSGGEDYELLFTASQRVKMLRKIDGVSITKIGRIVPHQQGLRLIGKSYQQAQWKQGGFQHF